MRKISSKVRIFSLLLTLPVWTGCGQTYSVEARKDSGDALNASDDRTLAMATEETTLATQEVRKIDLLFAVDNSSSMGDEQIKLRDGFARVAETYFRQSTLDTCIKIITTDRYMGAMTRKKDPVTGIWHDYSRERTVGCTLSGAPLDPSPEQWKTHIDGLIVDFKSQVAVGIQGSGNERVGTALATSLFRQNLYSPMLDTSAIDGWYRPEAYPVFSLVTDENNFYRSNAGYSPDPLLSDLPGHRRQRVPDYVGEPAAGTSDERMGIADAIELMLSKIKPGIRPDYAAIAMVELKTTHMTSVNLLDWIGHLAPQGFSTALGDLDGDTDAYERTFADAMRTIVRRIRAVRLAHVIHEPGLPARVSRLVVTLVHPDSTQVALGFGTDYQVIAPDRIELSETQVAALLPGDRLKVQYGYLR